LPRGRPLAPYGVSQNFANFLFHTATMPSRAPLELRLYVITEIADN
jgi:hypothetical protein